MGTVRQLRQQAAVSLGEAIGAYLATIDHPESRGTHRVYSGMLAELAERFGPGADVGELDPRAVAEWFAGRWGQAAPSTWNVKRSALRAAAAYWTAQGWTGADVAGMLRRRRTAPDRDRALSRAKVERLLTDEKIPLRERTLWRLLYESAARSAEVLAARRRGPGPRQPPRPGPGKGGAVDVIVWQTGTARLLPRLLKGRTSGPVFVTERRTRLPLAPCDVDPSGRARLSYTHAERLFKVASGGATLHQLRHSALSHDAEDGTSTPMLMARSGHTSVRSLAKYARVSPEALQRHQERRDPARRG